MGGHHAPNPPIHQVIRSQRKLPRAQPSKLAMMVSHERTACNPRQRPCMKHDAQNTAPHADNALRKPSVKRCRRHSNRNDQACYAHRPPSHCRKPASNMTQQSQMGHHYSSHHEKCIAEDAQGAMGMDDAQQIWTEVLLAGVMATFGRCAYAVKPVALMVGADQHRCAQPSNNLFICLLPYNCHLFVSFC